MIYDDLEAFKMALKNQEKKEKTINQYSNYITDFIEAMKIEKKEDITKEILIDYKDRLAKRHKGNINSINIKILILNKFITYLELPKELKLKQEKQQKATTLENVLTLKEYEHLRDYAKSHHQEQLYYLMRNFRGNRNKNKRIAIYNAWSGKETRGGHIQQRKSTKNTYSRQSKKRIARVLQGKRYKRGHHF